jgi:hypothetical protein
MTDDDVTLVFRRLREQNLLPVVLGVIDEVATLVRRQLLGELATKPALTPEKLGEFVYNQGKLAALQQVLGLLGSLGRVDDSIS